METMPFGKYRGALFRDLPNDYLDWLYTLDDLSFALWEAVDCEWRRRFATPDPPPTPTPERLGPASRVWLEDFLAGGFRACAKKAHPDVGGSHDQMLAVNDLLDFLRKVTQ